jgi:hypothetical protein
MLLTCATLCLSLYAGGVGGGDLRGGGVRRTHVITYYIWVFITNKGAQCENSKTTTDMRTAVIGRANRHGDHSLSHPQFIRQFVAQVSTVDSRLRARARPLPL